MQTASFELAGALQTWREPQCEPVPDYDERSGHHHEDGEGRTHAPERIVNDLFETENGGVHAPGLDGVGFVETCNSLLAEELREGNAFLTEGLEDR